MKVKDLMNKLMFYDMDRTIEFYIEEKFGEESEFEIIEFSSYCNLPYIYFKKKSPEDNYL